MNPSSDMTPGLGLPQPSAQIGQAPLGYPPTAPAMMPSGFTAPSVPPPASTVPAGLPQVGPPPQPQQPFPPTQNIASTGQESDANDSTLDAEWVSKAKDVVTRTHLDPYLQSKELSHIKAQYIQARYNKEIKTSEEP